MAATITNGRLNVVGLINEAKEAIRNLNLFRSIPPVQDALKLRKQLFSTRLFLLLFIISLITFTIYTSQVTIIRRVTVQNPSYSSYKQLFAQYSHTLSCPCTTISIPQKEFLQLNASYHTVCSSKFVQQQWMNLLSRSQTTSIASFEFRYTGASFFQMLASFCLLSKQLIDDELLTFADTPFITADVMPADRLMEQSQASISLLISNMETGFMRLISLVDLSTNTDGLVSGLFTNVNYRILPFDSYWSQVAPTPHTFEETNCTCFRGNTCIMSAYITVDG
jgi:hypothetical protein